MENKCEKGYKEKDGKCVKVDYVHSGKSYNPFKMIGSWIGFVLGFGIIFFPVLKGNIPTSSADDYSLYQVISNGFSVNFSGWLMLIGLLLISIVAGFLVGWGIHSLIRKFKK